MENNSETPCPFVSAQQLSSFVNKPVVVAGSIASVTDRTMILDGGDGSKITINRSQPVLFPVEPGVAVMVRGFVNPDSSIVESKEFPPTPLGEAFDVKLYNDVAAVTSNINFVHMFNK